MIRTLLLSSLLLFALVFQAAAATIDGKWKGNFAEGGDITFDLKADGSQLTGTMIGSDGKSYPVTKGEFKDGKLSFTVVTEYQGSPITVLLKGSLDGETIKITMATEDGSWSTDTTMSKV